MKCPNCGSPNYRCYNSRVFDDQRYRYHKCANCETKFKTVEIIIKIKLPGDRWENMCEV